MGKNNKGNGKKDANIKPKQIDDSGECNGIRTGVGYGDGHGCSHRETGKMISAALGTIYYLLPQFYQWSYIIII